MIDRVLRSARFRSKAAVRRLSRVIGGVRKTIDLPKEDNYARFAADLESFIGPLDGKRVLEVGSDADGRLLRAMMSRADLECAVGVNPAIPESTEQGRLSLLREDARRLELADGSIDVVVSLSVFEHVHGLDEVLAEMYRVLKPGGHLYSEFGPIWSSVWGHHLWFYYGSEVVDWRSHRLPPYAHLLMTPAELHAWAADRFRDEELAAQIVTFVFESPDQNRLFFSDYEAIGQESDFEVLLVSGCPDLPISHDCDVAKRLQAVRLRNPSKSGFGYHVIRMLLRKPVAQS